MKRCDVSWWLIRYLGRRGSTLVLLCLIDLTFAFFYFNPGPPERRSTSVVFLQSIAPLWFWGALWTAVGLICLQQAFGGKDRIGFGCAVLLKVLWAILHAGGWIFADVQRGYLYTVLWLVAAGWVYIISTWPEPMRTARGRPPVVPEPDGGE